MSYVTLNGLNFPMLTLTERGVITPDVIGQEGCILSAKYDEVTAAPLYAIDTTEQGYAYTQIYPYLGGIGFALFDAAKELGASGGFNVSGEMEGSPVYVTIAEYYDSTESKWLYYFVLISSLSFNAVTEVTENFPDLNTHLTKGVLLDNSNYKITSGGDTFYTLFDHTSHEPQPDSPYEPGGYAGPEWGSGDFDATSDIIGMPDFPSISAIDTGFLTLFVPSIEQVKSLQEYLWTDLLEGIKDGSLTTIVDSMKKIVSDPYQAIMGMSILPVSIPIAGSKDVKMYGALDSGVVMPYASTQWVEVDCGALNVHEFWGNYMDYAPYTKITSLYLPFVGVVSVDVDELMGKNVRIKYRIDVLTGQCIAFIIINGSVEYQYQGHCATSIPITASDFSTTITAGLNLISHVSAGVAGIAGGALTGAITGGIGGAFGAVGAAANAAQNIASDVMNAKPNIKAGSSIGGSGGLLSVKKPYFIAIRPKQCVATFQKSFTGFPINETYAVRQLTGYTEFECINLDGIPLTQPEKEELERLLLGGVYL